MPDLFLYFLQNEHWLQQARECWDAAEPIGDVLTRDEVAANLLASRIKHDLDWNGLAARLVAEVETVELISAP